MVKHYIPKSLNEALSLLHHNDLEIIAGGTDLMVQRRTWANTPPNFKSTINIINLSELDYIKVKDNHLHIGATTKLTDVLNHKDTPELLKKSIYEIASPALRNIATIAGNIGNASPAGDTLPILYILNAKVKILSLNEEILVPIEEVILGPRKTILQRSEIMSEIIIPIESFSSYTFTKVGGRKADAISKISFTACASVQNNLINDIRFAFGAVGPVVVRVKKIEQSLISKTTKEVKNLINDILKDYSYHITPIDDQRSNKKYRHKVALNLLKDFIENL